MLQNLSCLLSLSVGYDRCSLRSAINMQGRINNNYTASETKNILVKVIKYKRQTQKMSLVRMETVKRNTPKVILCVCVGGNPAFPFILTLDVSSRSSQGLLPRLTTQVLPLVSPQQSSPSAPKSPNTSVCPGGSPYNPSAHAPSSPFHPTKCPLRPSLNYRCVTGSTGRC